MKDQPLHDALLKISKVASVHNCTLGRIDLLRGFGEIRKLCAEVLDDVPMTSPRKSVYCGDMSKLGRVL